MAGALTSEAAARNREPILAVLRRVLPRQGTVLEIASGTGEHAVHFARTLPGVLWQPSDIDPAALASIAAHRAAAGIASLAPPVVLDAAAAATAWPLARADAVVAINLLHIAPWRVTQGLIAGAGTVLPAGGVLVLYGAFREGGRHTAPSNAAFDAALRARDPQWGVRDLEEVCALASAHGLDLAERVAMPANNLTLVFRRRAAAPD
jgi:SAM-dependent methyltransferase